MGIWKILKKINPPIIIPSNPKLPPHQMVTHGILTWTRPPALENLNELGPLSKRAFVLTVPYLSASSCALYSSLPDSSFAISVSLFAESFHMTYAIIVPRSTTVGRQMQKHPMVESIEGDNHRVQLIVELVGYGALRRLSSCLERILECGKDEPTNLQQLICNVKGGVDVQH